MKSKCFFMAIWPLNCFRGFLILLLNIRLKTKPGKSFFWMAASEDGVHRKCLSFLLDYSVKFNNWHLGSQNP